MSDFFDDEFIKPTTPYQKAVVTNAMPQVRQNVTTLSPQVQATMNSAELANQKMRDMQHPRYNVYNEKRMLRNYSPEQRREMMQQMTARHMALNGLTGDTPLENKIDLHDPSSATLDQHIAADWKDLSPEMRAIYQTAKTSADDDVSRLLSGTDKTAFNSTDDIEAALHGLPAIRKYGALAEGHIRNAIMSHLPPAMKGQFAANDQSFDSFKSWFNQKGYDSGGQTPEGAWAEMHGRGPFRGEQITQRGRMLSNEWNSDPNAAKFDYDPKLGKVVRRPLSPEQIQSQRTAVTGAEQERQRGLVNQQKDDELANHQKESKALFDQYPELKGRMYLDPKKGLQPIPKDPDAPAKTNRSDDKDYALARDAYENNQPVVEIPIKGDRSMFITPTHPRALDYFDAYDKEGKKVAPLMVKSFKDGGKGDELEYRPKNGRKLWEPEEDTTAASPAQATPAGATGATAGAQAGAPAVAPQANAPQVDHNAALEWAKANPNDPRAAKILQRIPQGR